MDFAAALEAAEFRLAELADGALDRPITGRETACVMGIGLHAAAIWLGGVRECLAEAVAPAAVLVRSLVDAAILVRWIEVDPVLHVAMYFAEDDRQRLAAGTAIDELRGRRGWPATSGRAFDAKDERRLRDGIKADRAKAKRRGEPIGDAGSVLPNVENMARTTDDLWEAYTVAYRVTSPWTHAGGRAIAGHELEERLDGHHIIPQTMMTVHQVRSLAAPTFAHLLASVSRQAELGVHEECDHIRLTLVGWPSEVLSGGTAAEP
jgi:hypothetical protein